MGGLVFRTHRQELGENIRSARVAKGYSTRVFAGMVGINRRNLLLIESGAISPKVVTVERIAAGLGVTVAMLVDFKTSGDE